MEQSKIGLYIINESKNELFSEQASLIMEAASTIKLAIVHKALEDAVASGLKPRAIKLQILNKHLSLGSGILNWNRKRQLSLMKLIFYALSYSDCVATNVLIDYVGGKAIFNKWMQEKGFEDTRLVVDSMYPLDSPTQPEVAMTSARDLAAISHDIFFHHGHDRHYRKLHKYLMNSKLSWMRFYTDNNSDLNMCFKTGSIIYDQPGLTSNINAVGMAEVNGAMLFYGVLSEYVFVKDAWATKLEIEKSKNNVANRLILEIRKAADNI